jgi:hypothetical protein
LHRVVEVLRPREAVLVSLLSSSNTPVPKRVEGYAHRGFTQYIFEQQDHIRSVTMVVPDEQSMHALFALPHCSALTRVDLRFATDSCHTFLLQYMPSLRHITLTGFNVVLTADVVPRMPHVLDLHVTASHSLHLDVSRFPGLRSICIHGPQCMDVCIAGTWPSGLECMVLCLHGLDTTMLSMIEKDCPALRHVNLSENGMTYVPEGLFRNMSALETVVLRHNTFVSRNHDNQDDGMMLAGVRDMHPDASLDILDLSDNVGVSCDDLNRYLCRARPRILDVRGCSQGSGFEMGGECFARVEVLLTSFLLDRITMLTTFPKLKTIWLQQPSPRVPSPGEVVSSSFEALRQHPCTCFMDMMQPTVSSDVHTQLLTVGGRQIRLVLCERMMDVRDVLRFREYC